MSTEKEKILASIRSAIGPLPNRAPYPDWDEAITISRRLDPSQSLVDLFAKHIIAASGRIVRSPEELAKLLAGENATCGYCDPVLMNRLPAMEGVKIDTQLDRDNIDRYEFGITRAFAGIAETGTLVLKDSITSDRLGALAPWIHIAFLEEAHILPSVADAVNQFGDDPSIIFATGPSKTADVEGILIEGVHGPGIQVAWIG